MTVRTGAFAWSGFVLAVFGWSCGQGSPTGPTRALSPALATSAQLEKRGEPGPPALASFTVTFSGNVSGAPQQFVNTTHAEDWLIASSITLDLSFFRGLPGGAMCFDRATYAGQLQLGQLTDPSAGIAYFIFEAKGTDGNVVGYKLELSGEIGDPGNWPPAQGTSNTIQGGVFNLTTPTPRPKRSGAACLGSGDLTYRIDLNRDQN